MAKFLEKRQIFNSSSGFFNIPPIPNILTIPTDSAPAQSSSTSLSDGLGNLIPQTTQSLVETVILVAPSGTVGGAIIITSVPVAVVTPSVSQNSLTEILPSEALSHLSHSSVSRLPSRITSDGATPSGVSSRIQRTASASAPSDILSFTSHPDLLTQSSASHLLSSTEAVESKSTFQTSFTLGSSFTSSLPSSSGHLHTSSLTSTMITSSSSTTVSLLSATSAPGDLKQTKPLSVGGLAAVGVSSVGAALIAGLLLLFLCNRRRNRKQREPLVYPEEAYLYDPPIIESDRGPINMETTEYRRQGETGSVYGVQGASLVAAGLARPRTPDSTVNERDSLLSRVMLGSRPRTGSDTLVNSSIGGSPPRLRTTMRDLMNPQGGSYAPTPTDDPDAHISPALATGSTASQAFSPLRLNPLSPGGGYSPAPTEEADLADQAHNPFADPPPDTSYNGGASVMDPDAIRPVGPAP